MCLLNVVHHASINIAFVHVAQKKENIFSPVWWAVIAISLSFNPAQLEHLQEFVIFYLAYLVFCQLLKRYAK